MARRSSGPSFTRNIITVLVTMMLMIGGWPVASVPHAQAEDFENFTLDPMPPFREFDPIPPPDPVLLPPYSESDYPGYDPQTEPPETDPPYTPRNWRDYPAYSPFHQSGYLPYVFDPLPDFAPFDPYEPF